jgi:hypothetical protein
MSASESVSTLVALVSAVFAGLAVLAAFRSSSSAERARQSAEDSERRAALRQAISTARELELEAKRITDAAGLAARSRRDLAVFTGNVGGSREGLSRERYAARVKRAEEMADESKPFSGHPNVLAAAPLTDVDRVLTKLIAVLSEATALRDDLEKERAELEAQCTTFREVALQKRTPQ